MALFFFSFFFLSFVEICAREVAQYLAVIPLLCDILISRLFIILSPCAFASAQTGHGRVHRQIEKKACILQSEKNIAEHENIASPCNNIPRKRETERIPRARSATGIM